jgi:hypothetical protein
MGGGGGGREWGKLHVMLIKDTFRREKQQHLSEAVLGIRMFSGLPGPDPDPSVRGTDPDPAPDPSLF